MISKTYIYVSLIFLSLLSCASNEKIEIIQVQPVIQPEIFNRPASTPNFKLMLESFQQVDDLSIMTYHGNFDEFVHQHHQQMMHYFDTLSTKPVNPFHCSIFSCFSDSGHSLYGRNFDNKDTDLLMGFYFPDSGYASIAFTPMIEFGFAKLNKDSEKDRAILLNGPIVSIEGMNEKGVVAALASMDRQSVKPDSTKGYRFLIHLIREILDHAGTVDEAVTIASRYNIFDNGKHIISHHILIAGPEKKSVVLEWHDGTMQVIPGDDNYQVITNSKLYTVSATARRNACRRYKIIDHNLKNSDHPLDWRKGMDILKQAKQVNEVYHLESGRIIVSTRWSLVFDLDMKEVYICLNRNFNSIYKARLEKVRS